jgi:methionine-gamma-lyase
MARRLFDGLGYGAVLAFALDGPPELQNRFVAELRVITSAVSVGHDESLIVHVGAGDAGRARYWPAEFRDRGHLRLSIGLEEPDDLVADLEAALDAVTPRR